MHDNVSQCTVQYNTTRTHVRCFNGHFLRKPGSAGCRLDSPHPLITGCCISQCAKYRESGIFGYRWEQNPWTDHHETWGA